MLPCMLRYMYVHVRRQMQFIGIMHITVRVEYFVGGLFSRFSRVIPNLRILILGTKCNRRGFNTWLNMRLRATSLLNIIIHSKI